MKFPTENRVSGPGERVELNRSIYDVSSEASLAANPNLLGTRLTQEGYGAVVPDEALQKRWRARRQDLYHGHWNGRDRTLDLDRDCGLGTQHRPVQVRPR